MLYVICPGCGKYATVEDWGPRDKSGTAELICSPCWDLSVGGGPADLSRGGTAKEAPARRAVPELDFGDVGVPAKAKAFDAASLGATEKVAIEPAAPIAATSTYDVSYVSPRTARRVLRQRGQCLLCGEQLGGQRVCACGTTFKVCSAGTSCRGSGRLCPDCLKGKLEKELREELDRGIAQGLGEGVDTRQRLRFLSQVQENAARDARRRPPEPAPSVFDLDDLFS